MGLCPICGLPYQIGSSMPRRKSRHHLFPRRWYRGSKFTIDVCQKCHDEFHRLFKREDRWSKLECIYFWVTFCNFKCIDTLTAYPAIKKLLRGLK